MTLRSFPQSSSAYSGAALWLAAILAWMGAAFAPSGARAQGVPAPPPAAAPASAEESQPVPGLWVYALDFENQPVEKVHIRAIVGGTELPPQTTDSNGSVWIRGASPGQAARVWAQDEMWYSLDGALEGEVGGRPVILRVFPREFGGMGRERRVALHLSKLEALLETRERLSARAALLREAPLPLPSPRPEDASTTPVLRAEAGSGGATASAATPAREGEAAGVSPEALPAETSLEDFNPLALEPTWNTPALLPLVMFAAGLRNDAGDAIPPSGAAAAEPTTQPLLLETRVMDHLGHPVANALIELLALGPPPGYEVRRVDYERTDREGNVRFYSLRPGVWFRLECDEPGIGVGRSGVFQARRDGAVTALRPFVIRPPDQAACSGFAMRADGPASYARVELLAPNGFPLLTTLADEKGYFHLGPIAEEHQVVLRISHTDMYGGRIQVEYPWDPKWPGEIPLPLDALK